MIRSCTYCGDHNGTSGPHDCPGRQAAFPQIDEPVLVAVNRWWLNATLKEVARLPGAETLNRAAAELENSMQEIDE